MSDFALIAALVAAGTVILTCGIVVGALASHRPRSHIKQCATSRPGRAPKAVVDGVRNFDRELRGKMVYVWWMPGEPEDDLLGFISREHADACSHGEPGPFLRVVRNHHKLGPVSDERKLMKSLFAKWSKEKSE